MKKIIIILLLASSTTVNAQELQLPKSYTASEAAVVFAHALDLASTQRCLGAGSCHELNPYLARYENPLGFTTAKFGLVFGQLYLNRKLVRQKPFLATVINAGISSLITSIAVRNYRITK